MKLLLLLELALVLLFSCSVESKPEKTASSSSEADLKELISKENLTETALNGDHLTSVTIDTFLTINQETYLISFSADLSRFEDADYNAVITIKNSREDRILLMDSLLSSYPIISFDDYNGDTVPDIFLYKGAGARANEYGYLYIAGPQKNQFTRIEGFEYLCNAQLDANHIITSLCLSGVNTYAFYQINEQNELVRLGESLSSDGSEDAEQKVVFAYQQLAEKRSRKSLLDSLSQMCIRNTTDTFAMEILQTDDFSKMIPITEQLYQTIFPDQQGYSENAFYIFSCLPSQKEYLTLIIYQKNYEGENYRVDYLDLVNIAASGKCLDKIRLAARDNKVITYEVSSSLKNDTLSVTEITSSESSFDPPQDTLKTKHSIFKLNGNKRIDTLMVDQFFETY